MAVIVYIYIYIENYNAQQEVKLNINIVCLGFSGYVADVSQKHMLSHRSGNDSLTGYFSDRLSHWRIVNNSLLHLTMRSGLIM